MTILEKLKKEKEIILKKGIEITDEYNLVSNYGYKIKLNNQEYDLRHWKNCYGVEVDYWEVNHKCKATDEEKKILIELENELTSLK